MDSIDLLKQQLKLCYAKLAALEQPTKLTAYNRNETNTLRKKQQVLEEINQIKLQIKERQ